MGQRYFEHLYAEVCTALGHRVPRYDLWLRVWEAGADPSELTREHVRAFLESQLPGLLAEEGRFLDRKALRRLEKRVLDFDPRHPTPEERFGRPIAGTT
ncbi:MAG TPA: hypothetical protein ENI85_15430 [Deltaproteobacteria bacterium]|nr:hypothetical protein [Deltaproteobacteria bacterium]